MGKRTQYTQITPLPSNVPRQLAVELLHAHQEVIELNPLVTGVKAIEAPRDAPNDEYFSQWYEIAEVITWGFGMKKKISFKGVFHDLPYGMQSHTYAPMGVDLRIKYRIGGNQIGEPRETRELGVDTPLDGLYLRQDVEIVCNLALASFVKKETKETIGKMIDRLVKKAELLDEGKLHAMFEDGRLKTSKPAAFGETESSAAASTPPGSPTPSMHSSLSQPRVDRKGYGNYHEVARSQSQYRPNQHPSPHQHPGYVGQQDVRGGAELAAPVHTAIVSELPGSYEQPQRSPGLYPDPLKPQAPQSFRSELPGDMSFYTGTGTPSPRPSPQQVQVDPKPPVQYQSYAPPVNNNPAQALSIGSRSGAPTPEQRPAQTHTNHNSQGSIPEWQRNVSQNNDQIYSPSNYSRGSSEADDWNQTSSAVVPDHQRFAQLSVQQTPQAEHVTPLSQNNYSDASNVKCPVCNLFEGDAAAVNHHVSKAHFS